MESDDFQSGDFQVMLAEMLLDLKELKTGFSQLQQEVQHIRKTLPTRIQDATMGWLDTTAAAAALAPQGIRSAKQLKRIAALGVLCWADPNQPDSGQIRNVGTPAKPLYQFKIEACRDTLTWFLALSPEERERLYGDPDVA